MKIRQIILTLIISPILFAVSCADSDDVVKLKNHISLDAEGKKKGVVTISEDATTPIVVDVNLSYYVEKNTMIRFILQDNEDDILRIENEIVNISANTKTSQFKIYSNNKNTLTEEKTIEITIESDNSLLAMKSRFAIKVTPVEPSTELPEE